ncbi:glycosyltransferase family 2 protein [Globicatella sulfidifaciens]|uniref:Glycosyltransferase family 2 protein n=1 Tax=Globicatella sulfidifaciens TaxID=136093 RepID=A0A7X8C5P0_9LACT|nr:glycosyltransferase family 2 protein [Globicatella sulfidifaciens]NLJ19140.1 glycosyltransferase family 2 protein [Globicatella sulfidifaciens]
MKDLKTSPLVSIITPAYNAAEFISDTIESVLIQDYQNWEMIIIDDCSKDHTVDVINEFIEKEPRIRLIRRSENGGTAKTRNAGLNEAKGQYIAFLDSDDIWLPKKLTKQVDYMEKNDLAFTYTAYNRVQIFPDGKKKVKEVNVPLTQTYPQLLKENKIGCLTVMINQEKTGPLQMVDMRSRQDYALWLELTRKGFQPIGIQEILANYRVRGNSLSSNKLKMAKQNWRVFRDVEKLSLPVASWYFIQYAFLKLRTYMRYMK